MSAAPSWEPVGPESPAERTDPLLPVIPADLAAPPALDDHRLADLLAELDAEDLLTDEPAARPAPGRKDPAGRDGGEDAAARDAARPAPRPAAQRPTHPPALPAPRPAQPAPRPTGRYVRREYQPPPVPADAVSFTGVTRQPGSRIGTVLFTAFFLGIFLLILVEVVVSLLQASS